MTGSLHHNIINILTNGFRQKVREPKLEVLTPIPKFCSRVIYLLYVTYNTRFSYRGTSSIAIKLSRFFFYFVYTFGRPLLDIGDCYGWKRSASTVNSLKQNYYQFRCWTSYTAFKNRRYIFDNSLAQTAIFYLCYMTGLLVMCV